HLLLYCGTYVLVFVFHGDRRHRVLHSFPTRRSSDLATTSMRTRWSRSCASAKRRSPTKAWPARRSASTRCAARPASRGRTSSTSWPRPSPPATAPTTAPTPRLNSRGHTHSSTRSSAQTSGPTAFPERISPSSYDVEIVRRRTRKTPGASDADRDRKLKQ